MIWTTDESHVQRFIFSLFLLAAFFGAKHWLAITQPDQQGCEVAKLLGGWKDCRLVERKALFMNLRGCGSGDAHLYKVVGRLATGADAEVVVCCGAVFKGCTLRAAH